MPGTEPKVNPLTKVLQAAESLGLNPVRDDENCLYTTLEDFTRAPSLFRLVVIGCTGAGKSTLLNVLAGYSFAQSPPEYTFKWKKDGKEVPTRAGADGSIVPGVLFETNDTTDSVTKQTAFANISFRGDADRKVVVVDTPGHDDPAATDLDVSSEARETLGELAADLHNKLKALGHVHAILILHNDVVGNRLNPATYEILKMVHEKFAKAGHSVWDHVIIGYSKCNAHETTWRANFQGKASQLREAVRKAIKKKCGESAEVTADFPVIPLGAGELEPSGPSNDEHVKNLERLWEELDKRKDSPLDTTDLQPFDGADKKWEKLINEKEAAEQKAKAALIYVIVCTKLASLLGILMLRNHILPGWMSFMLLNFSGMYDELLIISLIVYLLGPKDVASSVSIACEHHVTPRIKSALGPDVFDGGVWQLPQRVMANMNKPKAKAD